jgi:hypothetical protein
MKTWFFTLLASLFGNQTQPAKDKLFCVEECFVYTYPDSIILSNFYCIELDSVYYFAWDTSMYFKDDSQYLVLFEAKGFAGTEPKQFMAIPVDYYFDFEEIATCFLVLMSEEGLDPGDAIKEICKAYEGRDGEFEYSWPTTLKYSLYTKSAYN